MMTSLADKTALITGASRGMGRATALALAAAGARVIVHFGRNADEAKTVVDRIRAAGGRADAVSADLAAPDGAHALAAQVRNLIGDRLDIFVSNAGISNATAFENMTVKDFDNLFAVNVRPLTSSCSSCCQSWLMAATSCSSLRSGRAQPSAPYRPMQARRVPSTRW